MNEHRIPATLRALPQWVNWDSERRIDKDGQPYRTKVPYRPALTDPKRKARAGDPATWGTFAAALDAYRAGRFDGIGFEFHVTDPYFGIDLDGVRDPATGALTERAAALVALAGTYTEPSPSGRGLHLIGRGELPRPEIAPGRNGRKGGGCELYGAAHFFTMTGAPLPGHGQFADIAPATMRQLYRLMWSDEPPAGARQALTPSVPPTTGATLADAELIERATAARNGAKFARLWAGDTGDYGGDDSAADAALCTLLAFWTGPDPARIDRLFRQSGLYRPKWERPDYRERTIGLALGRGQFWTPVRWPTFQYAEVSYGN